MKKNYLLLLILTAFLGNAQVSQNFEGLTGVEFTGSNLCYYQDLNTTTVHDLVNFTNSCGTVIVTAPDSGTTLGFANSLNPTGVGFSDFDAFGVATSAGVASQIPEGPLEGNQSFVMEDIDGIVTMRFGKVNLTGTTNPAVSLLYHLESTGWEASDLLNVYVEITGATCTPTTVTLIDTTGQDIDNLGIENTTNTLNQNLSAYTGCIAQLFIVFASDSASEELIIDNIVFTEGVLDSTLSTENFTLDNAFTVSPNPSNGTITIGNSGIAMDNVTISDLNGRVVANYNLNGTTENKELNLGSVLSSGMYLMTITSQDASTVKKIVIK